MKLRENYKKVYSWEEECERFKGLIENVVKTANGEPTSFNFSFFSVHLLKFYATCMKLNLMCRLSCIR